jgi:hypothetical protein
MSQCELKAEAIRRLRLFVGTDATGHAIAAWRCLVGMEINLAKVKTVAQWVPAYAAGLLAGLEATE